MEPVRVLQVVTIMDYGGIETMLMNYYRKLDKNKMQFDFMVHRQERGKYDDEIEALGGRIYRMSPIRPGNYRKYFKELDDFFDIHTEYKVVHSHINENSGFVLRAAKEHNIPCRIAHSHLADLKLDYKYPFRLYGRHFLKDNATNYFACSKKAGEWLFGKKLSDEGKVTVLNNAVDTEAFEPNEDIRQHMRKELKVDSKRVIGHVGRFNPQKNHEFLIDIFKEVHDRDCNTALILVGDGYLKEKIENKVDKLNLAGSVQFLGNRSDVNDIMQVMDVFMFPSLYEGLPVVLVEAQAAGLNCIVSSSISKESDLTGRVKFLNLKDNVKKWADAVLSTSTKKEKCSEALIHKGYDAKTNINKLMNLYSEFYKAR